MTTSVDLEQYSTACRLAASAYIRQSTRFRVNDLRIVDARPALRQFILKVRHDLDVVADTQEYHGRQTPEPGDATIADPNWYYQEVGLQIEAERSRRETIDSLVDDVTQRGYASISQRTRIRTHPRRLFHTYTCAGCHGGGTVTCHSCFGSGQVSCSWCHGRGRTSCSNCGGSGTCTAHRTFTDHDGSTRTHMETHACHACHGGSVSCSWCHGSGRKRCGSCGGTGRVTCADCSGHGCRTKVTAIHTDTVPHFSGEYPGDVPAYVHAAVTRAGFPSLARYGDISLQDVASASATPAVEFVYACTMPFCEMTVELRGQLSHWVLFGRAPQIHDAGGVLETLLEADAGQLHAMANGRARWLPWFQVSAQQTMANFLASDLNQEIIKGDTEGLKPYAIRERVKRSVSESYVKRSLQDLHALVAASAHWSRVGWVLAFILLALPFALVASACLHTERIDVAAPAAQFFLYAPDPTGFLWGMAWLTLPLTLPGWFVARWLSTRWLRKAGGTAAVAWAGHRGLVMGKWTALAVIASALGVTGMVFNRWPLWIDGGGRAYGALSLFQAPHLVEPVPAPALLPASVPVAEPAPAPVAKDKPPAKKRVKKPVKKKMPEHTPADDAKPADAHASPLPAEGRTLSG